MNLFGLFFLAAFVLPTFAVADEFRIETIVYREGQSQPISENLTLFSGNLIFDFMLRPDKTRFPQEIVIYNVAAKRFVLLDTRRQVRTEMIEGELLKILSALSSSNIINEKNKFLFQPEFQQDYDLGTGWLTLRHSQLTYRAQGERPPNDLLLHRYYEFIDQFARLNATDPRRMPPFARLKLNAAIKHHGFIPSRVEMTLVPEPADPDNKVKVYSEHLVMWELSDKDRKRIESAKRYWVDFEEVNLSNFRGIETKSEPDE